MLCVGTEKHRAGWKPFKLQPSKIKLLKAACPYGTPVGLATNRCHRGTGIEYVGKTDRIFRDEPTRVRIVPTCPALVELLTQVSTHTFSLAGQTKSEDSY